MLLLLSTLASAESSPKAAKVLGIIEGSSGGALWLGGYLGFGLAEYTYNPDYTYPFFAGWMGGGAVLMGDGWARLAAGRQLQRAGKPDSFEAQQRFHRTIAIGDFAAAGVNGVFGMGCLLWSLNLDRQDAEDARHARGVGAVLLVEGLAAGGLGLLQWSLGGSILSPEAMLLPDGTLIAGVGGSF